MKLLIGLAGMAAVFLTLEHVFDPPQPSVIITVPDPSAPPARDLELGHD
jgi:hypothetical protein